MLQPCLRLKIELELVALDGAAQVELYRVMLAYLLIHFGFEEADRAAAFGLGAIECSIGIGRERVGISPVVGK